MSAHKHLAMTPSFRLPGVFCLTGSTQYWTGMTMFRMQEFYESRFDQLRGKFFSFERGMDLYANPNGSFDYAQYWAGFNVPGQVVDDFFDLFYGTLSEKETVLLDLIRINRPHAWKSGGFYLIGTYDGAAPGYLAHELAHAAYYLNPTYKRDMNRLIQKMPKLSFKRFSKWAQSEGYGENVLLDECQAYLSTNTNVENRESFEIAPNIVEPFRDYYREYMKQHKPGSKQ